MWDRLRHLIVGPPLPSRQFAHRKLNKVRALAALSPDALSSIAYANQEIYLGLIVAGSVGLSQSIPIASAVTILMAIVALSYCQTVHAYPSGGGSYTVARENLGQLPGLVSAAALLMDYLLTAAVSITAGVAAIASAFPSMWSHRVGLSLIILVVITLLNLRGIRETGTVMAIPVYLFLFTYLPMLAYGSVLVLTDGPSAASTISSISAAQPLTVFLLLRTFASGCTALTGIEAISNGVPIFRSPESKNASRTLIVMAVLMGVLFLGSLGITQLLGVVSGPQETILSALARRLLGSGPAYLIVQVSTMLILAVAANTSFTGFPRLVSILAADHHLPRQLANLGDRLVFANGILVLAAATGVLIVFFDADTHALVPLFAVGVYVAFTLSQVGMVAHWLHHRGTTWWLKAALNGVGGLATAVTLAVVGINKLVEGAWIIILLIPVIVYGFCKVHNHYREVDEQLSLAKAPQLAKQPFPTRVVVPVAGVNRGMVDAINYARSISKNVIAVFVELEPGTGKGIHEDWERWWPDVKLVILDSPYRSVVGPFLDFLDKTDEEHNDGQLVAVVLPEWVPAKWWQGILHNQTARLIRHALIYHRRHLGFQRVIIEVPYHLRR